MSTAARRKPPGQREPVKRARKKEDDEVSSGQRNWKMDFAARHGITTPLLDPNPKPPTHSFGRGE